MLPTLTFNLDLQPFEPCSNLILDMTPNLDLQQIANVVRGLTSVNYSLSSQLLTQLAVVLVAGDCQRMEYGRDLDFKNVFYGFANQV